MADTAEVAGDAESLLTGIKTPAAAEASPAAEAETGAPAAAPPSSKSDDGEKAKKASKSAPKSASKKKGKKDETTAAAPTRSPSVSAAAFGFDSGEGDSRMVVTVGFAEGALGMKLKSFRDGKGAVITSMDPNGLAGKTEKLQVGDRLLKIAGVRMDQKSMKVIVAKIKKTKRPCKFTFSRAK